MSNFPLKAQVFFTKRLSFLLEAEVPILEALTMLKDQTNLKTHKDVVERIIADVSRGHSLGKSLARPPAPFAPADIAIIAVGESSGTLRENLAYLGTELEKREKTRGKILAALIYPALVLSAAFGIVAFLLIYLFPKITPVFASLHQQLPFSTRTVIALSGFLEHWWILLVVVVSVAVCGVIFFIRNNAQAKRTRDRALISLPLIGPLMRRHTLAQSMRTLGLLLKSGIALPDSLMATAAAVQNCLYREAFETFADDARRGERLAAAFTKEPLLFPEVCAQMAAVGERSGNLSESFLYLSGFFEQETESALTRFSGTLEPALMISMGFVVAFIAISIITPIYGITQNLHP